LLSILQATEDATDDYLHQTHHVLLQILAYKEDQNKSAEMLEKLAIVLFTRFIRPMWSIGPEDDDETSTSDSAPASHNNSMEDLFPDTAGLTQDEQDELTRLRLDAFCGNCVVKPIYV
jgi:hypothetical protein